MRVQNVIIGGGLAGGMVAQEYREQGGDGSVLVIARESHVPYHRPPLTKEFLRGEKPVDEVYMHPQEWWAEQGVDVRTGTSATAIDRGRRSVALSTGDEVEFERLALATGATPRQLPGARTMRTLDDSQALAETLAGGSGHLGVIGGGFIGVEAAASARMKGWEVTMAVRESVVWEHLFGAEGAAYFFSDIGDWTWFEYVGPGTGRVDVRGSMDDDDFVAYYLDDDGAVTACLGVNRSEEVNEAKELIADHRSAPVA